MHTKAINKSKRIAKDVIEKEIGNYNLCMDINETGDLQIRVYPIMPNGLYWDSPVSVFDVSAGECVVEAD